MSSVNDLDLEDNIEQLDIRMNSEELSTKGRLGKDFDTWAGIQERNRLAIEDARKNISLLGLPFTTAPEAQAAADAGEIPVGAVTWVRNAGDASLADEYINNAGTIEPTGRVMPSQEAFDRIASFISQMNLSLYKGNGPVFPWQTDIAGKVLLGYDSEKDCVIGAGLLAIDKVNELIQVQIKTALQQLGLAMYKGDGPVFPWYTDATGNKVLLGYDKELQRVVGAFTANANQILRAPLIPLAEHLRPIVKAMNIMQGYGQSLSVGAMGTPVISVTQPYSNLTFSTGPRGFNHIYTALAPLTEDSRTAPDGGTNRGETFCSGAANYATTLAAIENGADPADHVIFAATAGKGGTKIADLVKGTAWYNSNLLPQLNGAYALNPDSAVHVVPWLQGETDNDQSPPTTYPVYRGHLEGLQVSVEGDIKAINGQQSPVHFLTYQCSYKVRTSSGVALAQLDLAKENEKFHLTTPCYHLPFASDSTHLTNVGYKWLGAYIGRAYKTLVRDQCVPQYLKPISATLRGRVITLLTEPPVSPVAIDTSKLAPTTDNGFRVKGIVSNATQAIESMMTEGKQVFITLAEEPAEAVSLRYALDYLGTGLKILNGASGNLRDSEPSTVNIQGIERPMFNVCPHFEMNVIKVGE
ncbi:flagellar biosynthesis, cell-distal portion of basal-body rod [Raoultella terrigena]|uniref:hypothetical protein n=1 Tax=Raoultella terrigena TaxID=577 RepID=UPI001165B8EF|nr:hypothetical protein [Raoultella terrigena]VUC83274.1 flagellar biosynthesis, cell-distal portion of basal-body rod [Raoultella terrigena]